MRDKNARFPWSSLTYYMLAAELGPSGRATRRNHLSSHTHILLTPRKATYRPLLSEASCCHRRSGFGIQIKNRSEHMLCGRRGVLICPIAGLSAFVDKVPLGNSAKFQAFRKPCGDGEF